MLVLKIFIVVITAVQFYRISGIISSLVGDTRDLYFRGKIKRMHIYETINQMTEDERSKASSAIFHNEWPQALGKHPKGWKLMPQYLPMVIEWIPIPSKMDYFIPIGDYLGFLMKDSNI